MCGKPVDPLRSRHVRVIGGKVAAYCSEDCLKARPDATPIPKDERPRRRDSIDLRQAWEFVDDEPAEPAVLFDKRAAARRRSLMIVLMVVAAIGGYLAYHVL
jgi:hypothetical protein